MSWARLDDNRHDHEKVLGLGDGLEALAAVGLLDHGLTWAHRHRRTSKTPGLVPWGFLRQRAGKHCTKLVGMLLRVGLVEADDEDRGVFIHALRGSERVRIPLALRRAVYERDGYACAHCGSDESLSLDHIIPWSLGGEDSFENLQTLCTPCNSSKGASA